MEFGHRGTAWIEYAAMAGCAAVALAARDAAPVQQAGALAGATVVLVAVAAWIDARWARFRQGSGGAAR
jgi:Flp pilus assembly pilin Flp